MTNLALLTAPTRSPLPPISTLRTSGILSVLLEPSNVMARILDRRGVVG